ncbi:MAG: alpha/beta hydrolase family protein [Longimicrobiales bacterium]
MFHSHRRGAIAAAALITGAACTMSGCRDSAEPQDPNLIFVRNGAVRLAGTLDLPTTPGPYPVMVFVPGSGRTTREADRPAVDIALPQGIAVFRYDKRGLGQSTGTFEEVSTANSERVLADRASDVRAIVDYLATHPRIRANQIFLWGTSQGAWVAPLVAAQTTRVAFIICVSGGGSPVGTVIEYGRLGQDAALSIDELTRRVTTFAGPFGYDPRSTLAALRLPVLWIYGGQDRFTPSQLDIPRIQQLQNSNFTVKLYPRMTHDMVELETGTFPATLFPDVFEWAGPRLGLQR